MVDSLTRPDARPNVAIRAKAVAIGKIAGARIAQLVVLLFVLSTVLFFLLRLGGDPAAVLAPEGADDETLAAIRARYSLDQPLFIQYLTFLGQLVRLDFGVSLYSGQLAASVVMARIPATLMLAGLAIAVTAIIAIPLGTWLGGRDTGAPRTAVTILMGVLQGTPGFVTGLILIQIFAVMLGWLPSIARPDSPSSWVLPVFTLAAFLIPQLVRVLSAGTREARSNDFVRTAIANGASPNGALLGHVLPNSLLGTAALLGSQFAALLSGALITEFVFAWPGLGLILVDAVAKLDFPIIQAAVFFIALMVFLVNILVDLTFQLIDPRLRRKVIAS